MRTHEVIVLVKLKVSAVDEHVARLAGTAAIDNALKRCEGDGFDYDVAGGERFVESVQVKGTELWRA